MPGRQVRKILRQKEDQLHHLVPSEDDASETESSNSHPIPSHNIFDILNGDEQADEVDNAEEALTDNNDKVDKFTSDTRPKKKKNKNKNKNKKKDGIFSDGVGKQLGPEMECLSLHDISPTEQINPHRSKNDNQEEKSILWIDPKYLNGAKELQKIFGARVVKFVESQCASSSKSNHGRRRDRYMPRKTFLVSPSDHWPRLTGLLSMELIETKQGYNYFRYVRPLAYTEAQREFEAAKESHMLNNVAAILHHNPYHAESLLAMADYFKFSGEHDTAADTVAKCLYALECAWHPLFTPFRSNSLLEFAHETNRPLFSALFTHMKNLGKRGCHRSALEVCKLLLSLDPSDPMGALLCIDYYSLRAEEYSWFEKFAARYESDSSLCLFPNFLFSLAVSRFSIESSAGTCGSGSLDLMKQALLLHPTVVGRLVGRVPLKEGAWKDVLRSGFFKPEWTGNQTVDHLVGIYIERSHGIWRVPELQKFLMEAAFLIIEELKTGKNDARNWARVKNESFSAEKNEYSYLLVSDFSDTEPRMPPESLQNFTEGVENGEIRAGNGGGVGEMERGTADSVVRVNVSMG